MQTYYNRPVFYDQRHSKKIDATVWNVKHDGHSYSIPNGTLGRLKVSHYYGYVMIKNYFIKVRGVSYDDRPIERWLFVHRVDMKEFLPP